MAVKICGRQSGCERFLAGTVSVIWPFKNISQKLTFRNRLGVINVDFCWKCEIFYSTNLLLKGLKEREKMWPWKVPKSP
jgi:hypothetical protein